MKLNIGYNIKRLRTEKQMTQEELAKALGCSCQAVSRWENRQCYPDVELLPEIARFFDCSMEELMGAQDDKARIESVCAKASNDQFFDNEAAMASLRALQKEFPRDWKIKEEICSALTEGALCRVCRDGERFAYDSVASEMRQYGWEAKLHFDKEGFCNAEWIYRSLVLSAPEGEAEEWADQIVSNPYNTKEANMLLRYTDYRMDLKKAKYWQGKTLKRYTDCLAMQIRNASKTLEEQVENCRMRIALYNAVAGVPYEENGIVHNTLYLCERVDEGITLVSLASELGRENQTAQELEHLVRELKLYFTALKQKCVTVDNPYIDLSFEKMPDKRERFVVSLRQIVDRFPKQFKSTEWYRDAMIHITPLLVLE